MPTFYLQKLKHVATHNYKGSWKMQVSGVNEPGYNSITVDERRKCLQRQLTVSTSVDQTFPFSLLCMPIIQMGDRNNKILMNYDKYHERNTYGS